MKQVEYRKNIPPAQDVNVRCESDLQFRPHLISTKVRIWIFVEVSADNSFPDFLPPLPVPRFSNIPSEMYLN